MAVRTIGCLHAHYSNAARAFAAHTGAVVLDPLESVVRAIEGGEGVS